MVRKRTQDLVIFSVTPNEQHIGWAPWRLISDFPKEMEKLTLPTSNKIPLENFESKFSPPFDDMKLSFSILRKIDELYKEDWYDRATGRYSSESFGFVQLFLCDLRDCFWAQFDYKQANQQYIHLLDRIDYYRNEKKNYPIDEVVLLIGLMLWEKHVYQVLVNKRRTDIQKAKRLIENNCERLNKHYFVKLLNEVGFGSVQEKYKWIFKKLMREIEEDINVRLKPYENIKRETSPVFIFLNIKLVDLLKKHFSTLDETYKEIAEFYQIFGVPKVNDVDSTLVSNYYREWVNRKKELLEYINLLYCREL